MKYLGYKDKKTRALCLQIEKKSQICKFILKNVLNKKHKEKKQFYFNKLLLLSFFKSFYGSKKSPVRVVKRCVLTNRARGVSKKFGASRFVLRNLMQFGLVPGYSKAVW